MFVHLLWILFSVLLWLRFATYISSSKIGFSKLIKYLVCMYTRFHVDRYLLFTFYIFWYKNSVLHPWKKLEQSWNVSDVLCEIQVENLVDFVMRSLCLYFAKYTWYSININLSCKRWWVYSKTIMLRANVGNHSVAKTFLDNGYTHRYTDVLRPSKVQGNQIFYLLKIILVHIWYL